MEKRLGDVDTVIELGGEDAKILFLTNNGRRDLEVRMNGSCAGGTGAFIDQMATLSNITPSEMNELAGSTIKSTQWPPAVACSPSLTSSPF